MMYEHMLANGQRAVLIVKTTKWKDKGGLGKLDRMEKVH